MLLLLAAIGTITAERPKTCLVLGGGGAKGFAHIAVLELLEEMEITVDFIIGVSSGAIVGGLYAAGYSPQMMKEALLELDWSSLFLDSPVSPFENELGAGDLLFRFSNGALHRGLSPGQTAYTLFKTLTAKIPSYIDFDTLPIPFRAGVVTIPEGKAELIGKGDLAEAIRASIGLPGVFDPFEIDQKLFIDGGTLDNLPIRMARELGCEVIIASELFPGWESISTSPLEVPGLMLGLYFNVISREQYSMADAVLTAEVHNYSIMDFQKSNEIYSLAQGEKEKMRSELEKVKEMLASGLKDSSFSYSGSYRELPSLTPVSLNVTGALDRDIKYIEKYFSRLINGKPLEPANLEEFIKRVYKTGNYRFAAVRIDTRRDKTELELLLHPKEQKGIAFLLGGNYQGTFSGDAINKLSVQTGVQVQGLSGPGSVLFLNASWIDVLSFGMQYLQPLSPGAFVTARTEIMLDKEITVSGFKVNDAKENRLALFTGEVTGGILIDRYSILKASALFLTNLHDSSAMEDSRNTAVGFGTTFTFNTLDYLFLPSRGIYASLENRFYLPLPSGEPKFFDILYLNVQGILPVGRKFSIETGAAAGSDLSANLVRLKGLPAGFTAFDRLYFPNVCSTDQYYPHMAAVSVAIQFQPWKNLSILGGQLITSLSFSAGELLNEWEDFSLDDIIWNASLNIGVRIKNNFGLLLRFGAGVDISGSIMPFIAFDIGQAARSGIKPGH